MKNPTNLIKKFLKERMNDKTLFLILFGIIIFGLRLFNIQESIYDDEANYAYSLTVMDNFGFNHDFSSPFIFNFLYKPFILLFGLETWVFRLIPWLFGILNTILVYFVTVRMFGKRAAFCSVILMLVSFYPTLAALQFDAEGSLIMFLALLFLFAYVESCRLNSQKSFFWQIVAGISLGLAIITKYNAVCLVLIPLAYSFFLSSSRIENKSFQSKVKTTFHDVFFVYLIGFTLFIAALLLGIIVSPEHWLEFVPIISWQEGFGEDYRPQLVSPLGITMFFLWSTPLLFGSFVLNLFQNKLTRRKLLLPLTWVSTTIIFYTTAMTYGSMDRYFMHTIPALAMLGGYSLSQINFNKKDLVIGSLFTVFFTGFFFFLSSLPIKMIARFPELYLSELKQGNLYFLLSYTSASGPTFGVNFVTIFWSSLLAAIFVLGFILFRKRNVNLAKTMLILFFAAGFSFNLFLTSEYLFHLTTTDVSKVKSEMLSYTKDSAFSAPFYSNDAGLLWYLDHRQWKTRSDPASSTLGIPDTELGSKSVLIEKSISRRGGTVLLLHWPPLHPQSQALETISSCKLSKRFYSKNVLIGEVYSCPK